MDQHESFKDQTNDAPPSGEDAISSAIVIPQAAPVKEETAQLPMPSSCDNTAEKPAKPKAETAPVQSEKVLSRIEDAPKLAPELEERKPQPAAADAVLASASSDRRAPPRGRATLLAASLVFSAAFGAMIGVAVSGLVRPASVPTVVAGRTSMDELQALKENVVQARVELATMKSAMEAAARSSNAQFTRIAERVERMDRNQAEPAAKLNKAIETLDRLSRAEAAAPKETTGSIGQPQATAGGAPGNAGTLEGWVVRDVRRGTALLENRRLGLIEVEAGDVVPGLGRIESIRKQDGHWIVVTAKGTILPRR